MAKKLEIPSLLVNIVDGNGQAEGKETMEFEDYTANDFITKVRAKTGEFSTARNSKLRPYDALKKELLRNHLEWNDHDGEKKALHDMQKELIVYLKDIHEQAKDWRELQFMQKKHVARAEREIEMLSKDANFSNDSFYRKWKVYYIFEKQFIESIKEMQKRFGNEQQIHLLPKLFQLWETAAKHVAVLKTLNPRTQSSSKKKATATKPRSSKLKENDENYKKNTVKTSPQKVYKHVVKRAM